MKFLFDERGQDLTEYALLLAFVVMAAAALFLTSADSMTGIWNTTSNHLHRGNQVASS